MKNRSALTLALCIGAFTPLVHGAGVISMPQTKYSMEQCLNAALAAKSGEVKALEMELNNQVPVYEFTIAMEDKSEWEVTCNAMTGKVIALEEEIEQDAADATGHEERMKAAFDKLAKVSEEEARAIALRAHPGEVEEVERKMSASKVPVFEFEIAMANGVEREVEIDAVTGLIIGVEEEIYAIGDD